ncbi:MAG: DNA polymerase III subunit chi [Leptothrix sp. (in: b-proteobacteria)]
MTAVAFHFNVPDRRLYTCRLLRKAYRAGARVAVTGDSVLLAELDRLLWTFEPLEFVPHWRGQAATALPPRLAATPIVLIQEARTAVGYTVLVNLGEALVPGFEAFERVIEVVGRDERERGGARSRWRDYSARGLTIERHEVKS